MPVYDAPTMQARFHELGAARAAILSVSTPLREARDAFVADAGAQEETMNAAVREAETGLFDIDTERGLIARALDGQTGAPPDTSA